MSYIAWIRCIFFFFSFFFFNIEWWLIMWKYISRCSDNGLSITEREQNHIINLIHSNENWRNYALTNEFFGKGSFDWSDVIWCACLWLWIAFILLGVMTTWVDIKIVNILETLQPIQLQKTFTDFGRHNHMWPFLYACFLQSIVYKKTNLKEEKMEFTFCYRKFTCFNDITRLADEKTENLG